MIIKIAIISLSLITCSFGQGSNDSLMKKMVGEWNWASSCYGDFISVCYLPSSEGYQKSMTVFRDSQDSANQTFSYRIYVNDSLMHQGRSTTSSFQDQVGPEKMNFPPSPYSIHMIGDTIMNFVIGVMETHLYYLDRATAIQHVVAVDKKGGVVIKSEQSNKLLTLTITGVSSPADIRFFDVIGRNIGTYSGVKNGFIKVNTSLLSAGIYFVHITDKHHHWCKPICIQ